MTTPASKRVEKIIIFSVLFTILAGYFFVAVRLSAIESKLKTAINQYQTNKQATASQAKNIETLRLRLESAENHLGYIRADLAARLSFCYQERWRDEYIANNREE